MDAGRNDLWTELQWRGLVADSTDASSLQDHLLGGTCTIYVGFDPTADSLHVGSLLPLMTLRRVQKAGHRPVVLVGGGTGLIGDPSGKAGERQLNPEQIVKEWATRLKDQVRRFVDFDRGDDAALLLDNYEWLSTAPLIAFLRDIGKHFPLGAMLGREAVRSRMGRAGEGISYTEFSYQVLQAYDFLNLFDRHRCTIQMGGTDQWGNITAGIELIRRVRNESAHGVTLPLVVKSDGSKFGKTEAGTVWLDAEKTSPYEMYQFWLNSSDADSVQFLKYFTFLSEGEIEQLSRATKTAPEKREAQRRLAREVTELVHGAEAARSAERRSQILFGGDPGAVNGDREDGAGVEPIVLEASTPPRPLWRVLRDAKLTASSSEARRLVQQGGVTMDGERATDVDRVVAPGAHTFRLGKRRIFRVVIQTGAV